MAEGLCGGCAHLAPALDPVIRKAYLGQCLKIEWPYTVNIPLAGVPTECGYFEKGKPKVVAAAAERKVAAAAAPARVSRIEFYYSSGEAPGAQFHCDAARALELAGQLEAKGFGMKCVDMAAFRGELFPIYNAAVTGPPAAKRSVFGAKGALEPEFGRAVPALLVFFEGDDKRPGEVFPRMDRELNRLLGVEEALQRLLAA